MEIIESKIEQKYNDWNFDNHKVIDTTPTPSDFMQTVVDFMEFERKLALSEALYKAGFDVTIK